MRLYPNSFLKLIVLGNVLVILPLLAAIGYASLTVDDLTRRGVEAVRQASWAATLGYELQEELNNMERILRQYEVLRDSSLLDEYGVVRKQWHRSSEIYAAIPLLTGLVPRLADMREAEINAYRGLGPAAEGLPRLKSTITALRHDLHPLLNDATELIETEREEFRLRSETLWWRLMAALWSALALSGLLLWLGRRTVARLWSRFERALLALGKGQLDRSIQLKGPEDMQRVGRRLDWLRRRMLALESERTRVMRHASHELKTPLAALREGASLLNEGVAGTLSPQQAKIAKIMQANAIRLQALIDGVLSMQRASYARDHLETKPIRLDKVIEQALETLQLTARDRRLRITGSFVPLTVKGGDEELATLVGNLISNAVKFSHDGGVVRITLTRESENAVLDVIDDGPGINAEDSERLFEPFYRGSAGKGVPGAGLGLAIAHEFALAHRGSLEIVESEKGAHFRACLPLAGQAA